jgi:hypothetical protein
MLTNKSLDDVTEQDLIALKDDQVRESKTIDYKEMLPDNSDSKKKDFLANVSSFANAAGGHLIYGIKEVEGLAVDISGCDVADIDAEIRRLDSIIQSGLDPRVMRISIHGVKLSNSRVVIILRIPRSWSAPHMITFQDWARFYSRNSAGKYMLDVPEIRSAFLLTESTAEQIRKFRVERIERVLAGEEPVLLQDAPKLILHVVPLSAFDRVAGIDLEMAEGNSGQLRPMYEYISGWSLRRNFDGLLMYSRKSSEPVVESYTQVFRSGIIESVDAELMHDADRMIQITLLELEVIESTKRFLAFLKESGVEPPLLVFVSVMGVKGFYLRTDRTKLRGEPIDRDSLIPPEIIIENFQQEIAEVLRPVFDIIWNAGGFPKSPSYDDQGVWQYSR